MAEKNFSVNSFTNRLGDIRRSSHFILHIDFSPIGKDMLDSSLDLVVQEAFIPQYRLEVLEFRRANDSKKLPGQASWQGGTISILDTLSNVELELLQAWSEAIYNPNTGFIGRAENFKLSGSITEYASDGTLSRQWPLEGMWISGVDFGRLDAGSTELKRVSFTIEVDPPSKGLRPKYGDGYL